MVTKAGDKGNPEIGFLAELTNRVVSSGHRWSEDGMVDESVGHVHDLATKRPNPRKALEAFTALRLSALAHC
jgi:hypothetical protein